MKRIILTGGGTAGHVTPNIALLPRLRELQYDIHYIGSYNGMESSWLNSREFHIMVSLPVSSAGISAFRTLRIRSAS